MRKFPKLVLVVWMLCLPVFPSYGEDRLSLDSTERLLGFFLTEFKGRIDRLDQDLQAVRKQVDSQSVAVDRIVTVLGKPAQDADRLRRLEGALQEIDSLRKRQEDELVQFGRMKEDLAIEMSKVRSSSEALAGKVSSMEKGFTRTSKFNLDVQSLIDEVDSIKERLDLLEPKSVPPNNRSQIAPREVDREGSATPAIQSQ